MAKDLHRRLLVGTDGFKPIDLRGVDEIERQVHRAHRLYQRADYSAAARVFPRLIAEAERHAIRAGQAVRPHGILAAANLGAAKLAAKLGDGDLAWVLADRSMAGARQAEDVALHAVASAQAAISLAKDVRRLADAEALVQAAYDQLIATDNASATHLSAQGNLICLNHRVQSLIADLARSERKAATPGLRPLARRAGVVL